MDSILRKQIQRGYTHVANDLCNYEGMSFRAKGIALVLLSKPDNWEIRMSFLMRMTGDGGEGLQAIRTALHELAEHGFLKRVREQDALGHWRTITLIADYPAFLNDGTPQDRILGYNKAKSDAKKDRKPQATDLPETDMSETERSETDMSETERSETDMSLVIPDHPITEEVRPEEKIPLPQQTAKPEKRPETATAAENSKERSLSEIWATVMLEAQGHGPVMGQWLADSYLEQSEGGYCVRVKDRASLEWLQNRGTHTIKRTLASLVRQPIEVSFGVKP